MKSISMQNFFYDKGGFEKLLSFVIYLILVAIIMIGLLGFINTRISSEAIKEQILAKQIALNIDAAKPNTEIIIIKGKFIVSVSGNEVNVKADGTRGGYTYGFFTQNKIKIEQEENEGKLKIIVS